MTERMQHDGRRKLYRGMAIGFNPELPAGRLGRYSVGSRKFAQLQHARDYIDEELRQAG